MKNILVCRLQWKSQSKRYLELCTNTYGERLMDMGRAIIISGRKKEVLQSISNYIMSCFLLSKYLTQSLDDDSEFLVGRRQGKTDAWMAWHDLCKPRSMGGVGIRHLRTCNLAVLAKQCCRIFLHPDTLLSQIFRARHFPRTSLVQASISNRSSATWRSLLAPRLYIRQGLRWRVGDGNLVYTWDDPWLTNDGSV